MSRLMRRTPRTAGPEIDNVIEREAGLRSVREAARILGIGDDAVLAVIAKGGLPDAYRTSDDQWRIPLDDIRRHAQRQQEAGAPDAPHAAVLARRRYPHDTSPARRHAWMTPTERRHHITDQLEARRSVRVSTLSARLGVSQMTIRRDLARLEAEGCLTRSYGGAMTNRAGADLVPTPRCHERPAGAVA
jgi:excisionase family DNA binding protein